MKTGNCWAMIVLLFLSALPLAAQNNPYQRAGEFLIDSTLAYLPASGKTPASCSDGANFLTVWIDEGPESYTNICGTRVSQNGVVIDSACLWLSHIPTIQSHPSVAFGDTTFLAVWSDNRSGIYDIYATRLNRQGMVLDIDNILIASSPNHLLAPAVVYGTSSFFVVWKEQLSPTTGYIRGIRISVDGTLIDTAITINNLPIAQIPPSITFDGTHFFAVWAVATHLYGARIDTGGNLIDTTNIQIATNPGYKSNPEVSFDGTNYLAVWEDNRNGSFDIFGARIDTAGTVLDPSGLPIVTSSMSLEHPALAFTGLTYLLAWHDDRSGNKGIYATRVSTGGSALDSNGVEISAATYDQSEPSLAFNGTAELLVTWAVNDNGIAGCRIDTSCTLIDSVPYTVSLTVFPQWSPRLAFNGHQYFVAWHDGRNGTDFNVYGARIDTAGNVLDGTPVPIATQVVYQQLPAVSASAANYLIAWQDDRFANVYAARVDTGGILLDPTGFPITTANHEQEAPAVIFDGAKYFVVWHDRRNASGTGIYGTRVTVSGAVLNPAGIKISYSTGVDERYPSIATNGRHYLIAWGREQNTLCAALTDTSGMVLDTLTIVSTLSSNTGPCVESNGTDFLIVWEDNRDLESDIYATRVDSLGTVLDSAGIQLSVTAGDQMKPSATWDGYYYTVAWEDHEYNTTDLCGARVTTAGLVFNRFPLVTSKGNQFSPAMVKGSGDNLLLAYAGFADSMGTSQINAVRIWGSIFLPPAGIHGTDPAHKDTPAMLSSVQSPAFSSIAIAYTLAHAGPAAVTVYDASGRMIKTLAHGYHPSGTHHLTWSGDDGCGNRVRNGVYFFVLESGSCRCVRKVVFFR